MTEKEIREELTKLGKENKNAADWLVKLHDYETEDLAKMILVISDAYPTFKDRSELQYAAGLQALLIGLTIALRIVGDEDEKDIPRNIV